DLTCDPAATIEQQKALANLEEDVADASLRHLKDVPESRRHWLAALDEFRELKSIQPDSDKWPEKIARAYEWLADLEQQLGRLSKGIQYAKDSLAVRREILESAALKKASDSDKAWYATRVAMGLEWLGWSYYRAGRIDDLKNCFDEYEKLVEKYSA